ncbi:MAG: CoA-binding protein [Candidatus Diapherotrites archaeon]
MIAGENTRVVVQGANERQAMKTIELMKDYGTKISAFVCQEKIEEPNGFVCFNSLTQVIEEETKADCSVVCAQKSRVKDAVFEAVSNEIKLIVILTEDIPLHDSTEILALAREKEARIIGPSSAGIIVPEKTLVGYIGSPKPKELYSKGGIGIMSKSESLANETAWLMKKEGIGQSMVIETGSEMLSGTSFADLLQEFEEDKQTKALVLLGASSGSQEEKVAELLKEKKFSKPLIAFIAGKNSELLQPKNMTETEKILCRGTGNAKGKIEALKKAGAIIAENLDEIPEIIEKL